MTKQQTKQQQEKYIVIGCREIIDMENANEVLELGLEKRFPYLKGEELQDAIAEETLQYSKTEIVDRILEIAKKKGATIGAVSSLKKSYERITGEDSETGEEFEYWSIDLTEYVSLKATGYTSPAWTVLTSGGVESQKYMKIAKNDDEPTSKGSKTPKGEVIGEMVCIDEEVIEGDENETEVITYWDFQEIK